MAETAKAGQTLPCSRLAFKGRGKSRRNQRPLKPNQTMKFILHLLAYTALLPVTGCIFPGNRDYSDDDIGATVVSNRQYLRRKRKLTNERNLPKPAWGERA
jgi:hypothetical protein